MNFFGLDIGTRSIKIAQLERKKDGHHLVAFGSGPSTGKGLLSESESDLIGLAEVIKKIKQEARIRTKAVVTALPQDQVFTRTIDIPKLSDEELVSALKWEAEQFVPIPLEETTLAHQRIGEKKVLLVAAPNRLIEKMLKVIKAADLVALSLETEIFCMARSLVPPDSENVLLVDLGARATDFAVVEAGQVSFTHSVAVAGESLTKAVEFQLGLEPDQAEAYKKAYGADPGQLEGRLLKAIGPILEKIVLEMEKTIQFFTKKEDNKVISRVVLTGGTAGLPEVAAVLAKKLNLEVQLGDPFGQIIKGDLETKISSQQAFLFSVAVGAAMKEIQ